MEIILEELEEGKSWSNFILWKILKYFNPYSNAYKSLKFNNENSWGKISCENGVETLCGDT